MGIRRPVGVVGAIAPWNAALILSARAISAPLALGNTVVLKPSEWSPQVGGLLWGEVFAEAGLPAGVLNIVTHSPGEAQGVGDELIESPHVRRLNFTGSTATGRKLAEAAGRQLKRMVLELGGYNPLIVLADADLEYAVDATTFGAFLHQGQICMPASCRGRSLRSTSARRARGTRSGSLSAARCRTPVGPSPPRTSRWPASRSTRSGCGRTSTRVAVSSWPSGSPPRSPTSSAAAPRTSSSPRPPAQRPSATHCSPTTACP